MKFLTVCDGGNVRSYALAFKLKDRGHEAIAVGRLYISPETMQTMCDWADVVVIMQAHMKESIPESAHEKLRCVDVGVDRFGYWIHQDLIPMVENGADWLIKNHAS